MKIAALRFFNVKRFAGRGVAIEGIGDGVNLLCAANEEGKSTSFESLHALFFQPHRGAPKEVRRLQPYGGGAPLIEADIVTPQGRYRLSKQFLSGRRAAVCDLGSGRLIAQADEAENFIAGLIRGGPAGPAGLLWVRQGATGLEEQDRKEEEGERKVRESLLASVQGEVEAVTGGRRMAAIIAACEEELGRLVTATMRPKADGPYAAAIAEQERLAKEEQRLAAEVRALRDALDRRAKALQDLRELENPDEAASRRAAVERAERILQAAKDQSALLKTREAETALARQQRDAARQERDAFRAAMAKAKKLGEELAAAEGLRAGAEGRRVEAAGALDRARIEVAEAEGEEREAQALLERLEAAQRARRAADELIALRDRLAKAEAARAALETGEAALALMAIPAAAVEELQKLEVQIAGLRAAGEASLPSVGMAYGEGVALRLSMDGSPLEPGQTRSVRDVARIEAPGLGVLTLRSNRPASADAALEKAQARRGTLLKELRVGGVEEASRRRDEAQSRSAGIEALRLQIAHFAPEGLARLREEAARRAALPAPPPGPEADADEARQARARAGERLTLARGRAREIETLHDRAVADFGAAGIACAKLAAELKNVEAALGPGPERGVREQSFAGEFAERQARLESAEAALAKLRDAAADMGSVKAALHRARSVLKAAEETIAGLRVTLGESNGLIRARSDDAVEEAWRETEEALAVATARVEKFRAEIAALDRLRAALQTARKAARDLYLQPVVAELRPLLGLLFDDVSVNFDENSLLPQSLRRNGQDEEVERLSGGMREQLSILTRLAFARLLARDGRAAPVILDDALVYSDDDRIEKMFDALHRQANDQQIIVFSCRQRAFARLGGNILQMAPWRPDPA